jgi:hypothetical protein
MKFILKTTGVLALAAAGGAGYLYTQVNETKIPAHTMYYKEVQGTYEDAGKICGDLNKGFKAKLKEKYVNQKAGAYFIGYDNPDWVSDIKKMRSVVGHYVANDLAMDAAVKAAASEGNLKELKMNEVNVMEIKANFKGVYKLYFRACMSILICKYCCKYSKEIAKESAFPICEIVHNDGSRLFIPLPGAIKQFNLTTLPNPPMNEKGNEKMRKYCPCCLFKCAPKAAEQSKPVAPAPTQPATPQPAKPTEQLAAKPAEAPKKDQPAPKKEEPKKAESAPMKKPETKPAEASKPQIAPVKPAEVPKPAAKPAPVSPQPAKPAEPKKEEKPKK